MKWRTIITDSESMTGIAPVCEQQSEFGGPHSYRDDDDDMQIDEHGVYDCCPHPHIETWSEGVARLIAHSLTQAEAEPCS